MILRTKEFQEAANKILFASGLDQQAASAVLELFVKDSNLYLNVTNKEYYVSVKFALENPEEFHAVVSASLFLNLISGFTADTFELTVDENLVHIKSGKSTYKVAQIFENAQLMKLPVIQLANPTIEMDVDNSILMSILNVNSKELQKVKKADVMEIQRLYYIDETGCFTFTTGACLNRFTLEKPIKLLLNERVVKLFKLFKEDKIHLKFGYDPDVTGVNRPKVLFTTDSVYVAARINCDDALIHKIQGPCEATKAFIAESYKNRVVFDANTMLAAISRLMLFAKNSLASYNSLSVPITVTFNQDDIALADKLGNIEVIPIENSSVVDTSYSMVINMADMKNVLDSCRNEHLTMNCGNHRSVVLNHGSVSNLIPEGN